MLTLLLLSGSDPDWSYDFSEAVIFPQGELPTARDELIATCGERWLCVCLDWLAEAAQSARRLDASP